ncbi:MULTISPECIES: PAQR family membrane homeostasis protein TrhA [Nocardiopsis]|uniref:Channel protein, hemolysin III family n=1 Tax=Nocardiopsis dassonvillei (strain ATCC 23218 / DSM 43111 / CIP 107115 / JCM 7437 / KCTC 9190 / NBRC 14626 / NCTC 10488 / NRRL B-5397 / IMRU 509) TaxID=446468 RepID=D7AYK4_NOCDD|nr:MULTISPECIES: hemolysin III family protein [Nocardiopsis]ADH66189.1 channel protein, hemolysin III family [Nocardiopsis dassonvillei subsp. dassonvillei DSM 43111]APC34513.1 DNA-binding protein [Nocardiopsis dassonvillei]NKY78238.1 hemolysin III family protein [Nocardiopsis dassonvillei]VEI92209.1 hemolysin [Nocardiopsis dassonvillei]
MEECSVSEEQARGTGRTEADRKDHGAPRDGGRKPGSGTPSDASVPERAAAAAEELLEAVKPRLRGWLHLGTAPLALAAGIVLVSLSPTTPAMIASAVYALSAVMLFATSAVYHVGRWSPGAQKVLRRMDHSNIYLIIAGTYTPFVLLVLEGTLRTAMLALIWGGAIAGVGFKMLWLNAPRWLSTALYLAIGWVAVLFIPQLIGGTHPATWILILVGGVLYSVGAVVYGLKWPDPAPRWFGFHEIFHSLTIAAFVCHYVAVSFVVYTTG